MALWLVLVTLGSIVEIYGAAVWCQKASTDLRTFNCRTCPVGRSEMVGFGVCPRSTDTRCYTHWGLTLEFYLVVSQSPIERSWGKDQWYWDPFRTRLHIYRTGWTNPASRGVIWCDLSVFAIPVIYHDIINIIPYHIMTNHFKDLEGLWCKLW